jgi:hypothetical protein
MDMLGMALQVLGVIQHGDALLFPIEATALRAAVWWRYICSSENEVVYHRHLAQFFLKDVTPGLRRSEELPWHLVACRDWAMLKEFLVELNTFQGMLHANVMIRQELLSHWKLLSEGPLKSLPSTHNHHYGAASITTSSMSSANAMNGTFLHVGDAGPMLRGTFDPVEEYNHSIQEWYKNDHPPATRLSSIIMDVTKFMLLFSLRTDQNKLPTFCHAPITDRTLKLVGIDRAMLRSFFAVGSSSSSSNVNKAQSLSTKAGSNPLVEKKPSAKRRASIANSHGSKNNAAVTTNVSKDNAVGGSGNSGHRSEPESLIAEIESSLQLLENDDESSLFDGRCKIDDMLLPQSKNKLKLKQQDMVKSPDSAPGIASGNADRSTTAASQKQSNNRDTREISSIHYFFYRWLWIQFPWLALANCPSSKSQLHASETAERKSNNSRSAREKKVQSRKSRSAEGLQKGDGALSFGLEAGNEGASTLLDRFGGRSWKVKRVDPLHESATLHISENKMKAIMNSTMKQSSSEPLLLSQYGSKPNLIDGMQRSTENDVGDIIEADAKYLRSIKGGQRAAVILQRRHLKIMSGMTPKLAPPSILSQSQSVLSSMPSHNPIQSSLSNFDLAKGGKSVNFEDNSAVLNASATAGSALVSGGEKSTIIDVSRFSNPSFRSVRLGSKCPSVDNQNYEDRAEALPNHKMLFHGGSQSHQKGGNNSVQGIDTHMPVHLQSHPTSEWEEKFAASRASLHQLRRNYDKLRLQKEESKQRLGLLERKLQDRTIGALQASSEMKEGEGWMAEIANRLHAVEAAIEKGQTQGQFLKKIVKVCSLLPPGDHRHVKAIQNGVRLVDLQLRNFIKQKDALMVENDHLETHEARNLHQELDDNHLLHEGPGFEIGIHFVTCVCVHMCVYMCVCINV